MTKTPWSSPHKIWNLDQNIKNSKFYIWNSCFENIFRTTYKFFIFVHMFQWTPSEFFFNFRFSSKKSQSQQKLAKNITHFTIQFCSKNLTNFPTCFCLVLEKIFALHHIWTPKNCILGAFWKQISVYFWAYLQENFCSTDILPSIDIFRYFHL